MAPALSERLAAAGAEIDRACRLLLEPTLTRLDESGAILQAVVPEVTACRDESRDSYPNPAIRDQARRVAQSLRRARLLLESAARFHTEWIRCLGALSAGYTERGEPGAVARPTHLWAQG